MTGTFANGTHIDHDDLRPPGPEQEPPLLLVHGHPFDRSMWRPQAAAFPGRRTIAPDLRGYGRSGPAAGTTRLEVFADDLAALLDALGVERAVVAGLSMGGQIVLEFQRRHPGRVAGLVLAATSARTDTEEGRRERLRRAEEFERGGAAAMAAYAEEVLDSMLAPATIRALPATAAHVLAMMRAAPPAGAAAALRGRAERPDYREGLARIDVPALVVVGSEDVFTPVAEAELLHRGIPGARLAVVEGAGHLPNLERPEVFNQAVAALLAEVTATGRPHAPADVPSGAPVPVPADAPVPVPAVAPTPVPSDARAHGALPPDGSPQRPDSPSGEHRKAPQI